MKQQKASLPMAVMAMLAALGWFSSMEAGAQTTAPIKPAWAYPFLGASPPTVPNDGVQHQLPGSKLSLTKTEIFDLFTAHDWYPETHPEMPEVVARGRKASDVRACGMCHYPNAQGKPENAALAGLPYEYIVQQMADYKSGKRRSTEPKAGPQVRMLSTALNVSDEDVKIAAKYFSSLTYKPWIEVIETDTVPKTEVVIGNMLAAVEGAGAGTEPIGQRIIEIPREYQRVELRDPTAGFVTYVPKGSIAKGEQLVQTGGNGKTIACMTCHGPDLKGVGNIPPIAGRPVQYLARQIFDMKNGTRKGDAAIAMQPVIQKLSEEDVINILAYVGSRKP